MPAAKPATTSARPSSKGSQLGSARESKVAPAKPKVTPTTIRLSSIATGKGGSPLKSTAGSSTLNTTDGGASARRPSGMKSIGLGAAGSMTGSTVGGGGGENDKKQLFSNTGASTIASANTNASNSTNATNAAGGGGGGMGVTMAGAAGAGFGHSAAAPLTGIALYAQLTSVDGLNVHNPIFGLLAKHNHTSAQLDDERTEWNTTASTTGGAGAGGGAGGGGAYQSIGGGNPNGGGQGSGAPAASAAQYDEKGNLIPDPAIVGSGATDDPEVAAMLAEAAEREAIREQQIAAEQAANGGGAGGDGVQLDANRNPIPFDPTMAGSASLGGTGPGTYRTARSNGLGVGSGGTVADQLTAQVQHLIAALEHRQRAVADVSNVCGAALNRISDDLTNLKTQTKTLKLEQLTCIARAARI